MNVKKKTATELRDLGYSYSYISKELEIAKSTLSSWFRDRPFVPNRDTLIRIKSGQTKYGELKKQQRLKEVAELLKLGHNEIGNFTKRDLWMTGLGLWLGEGSKTTEQIRLANSDPTVIKIWLRWLREVCNARNENITLRMHLYPDSDIANCMQYWQTITGLPESSFRKTQFDLRQTKLKDRKGRLPYGTLHVSVISANNPNFGVRFHRRIRGWVSAII